MARVSAVVVAAFAFSLTSSWWENEVVDTVVWHSFGLVVAVAMWIGVARRPREERTPWIWLGAGLTAWVAGDVAWDVLSWNAPLPDLSLVDVFYLSGYACILIGLLVLVEATIGALPRDAVLDGLILAVAAGLVFWVTLVQPADDPGSAAYNGIALAYPIFAIALLATIAWVRLHPERRTLPSGTGLLSAAVLMLVVLEPVSAWYWFEEPDVELPPILDRLFQISFGLMVLAVHRRGDQVHQPRSHGLHPLRLLMLGASLAAAPVTMLLVEGSETQAVVAAAVVSTLVLARFTSLSRERERAQQDLAHQATHDPLTGLGNRSKLYELMDDSARSEPTGKDVSLLYLDIDNFKTINDTHGHAVGDALLAALSGRIRSSLRPGDVATRLGGDEFVILCQGSADLHDARVVADRLREVVAEPFELGDLSLTTTLSIGVASGGRGVGLDQLLRSADAALYKAKRDGRNATVVFDEVVGAELDARNRLDAALRYSLVNEGLTAHFHPLLEHKTGTTIAHVVAVDASLGDGDRVVVDLDLLTEEQAGMARDVAEWLIDETVIAWVNDVDRTPVFLPINAVHLCSPEFVTRILQKLGDAAIEPSRLIFEFRDDELRRLVRDAPRQVERLLSHGVALGVRDFGGEGSSLTAARTLPFTVARIDLDRDDLDEDIVESLSSLAEGLGLQTYVQGSGAAVSVKA